MRFYQQFVLLAGFIGLTVLTGCGPGKPAVESRWRFVGGNTLRNQTNAPVLANILKLPESAEIRPILVTNAASLLWQLTGNTSAPSGFALAAARDLATDLMDRLSLGETLLKPDGTREFAIAIQGDEKTAQIWSRSWSNFFTAARSKAGNPRVSLMNGWVIAVSDESVIDSRDAMKELVQIPAKPGDALRLEADLPNRPKAVLTAELRDGVVRPQLKLTTKSPLPQNAAAWEIPEMIRNPFVQFTALRETRLWIRELPFFDQLPDAAIPAQAFVWCQPLMDGPSAFRTYVAGRVADPKQLLGPAGKIFTDWSQKSGSNPFLSFGVEFRKEDPGFEITGFPFAQPRVNVVKEGAREYVVAGMWDPLGSTNPPPAQLIKELSRTNLLYYDWEATGESAIHWNAFWQMYEMAFQHMPENNPGGRWVVAASSLVQTTATEALVTGPNELTIKRRGPGGLSGFEMASLGSWIDWGLLRTNIALAKPKKK
jgi:hypothetical protein